MKAYAAVIITRPVSQDEYEGPRLVKRGVSEDIMPAEGPDDTFELDDSDYERFLKNGWIYNNDALPLKLRKASESSKGGGSELTAQELEALRHASGDTSTTDLNKNREGETGKRQDGATLTPSAAGSSAAVAATTPTTGSDGTDVAKDTGKENTTSTKVTPGTTTGTTTTDKGSAAAASNAQTKANAEI